MSERTEFFQHTFNGGFSSDRGSDVQAAPRSGDVIPVPFLIDAENVIYSLDGGPGRAPGTSRLNSTVLEAGSVIKGLFDFWLTGAAGSPTQYRIAHVGTKIKRDSADGTFIDLFTGLESGKVPDYSVLEDLLVMSSDSTTDVPKSWDGTTAQSLAGSPPNFAFSEVHVNRLWAAGDATQPSRLYYSTSLNAADWTGKGSGYIDISPDDGDSITGIASHKGNLFVFKGPYKGSIHFITGTSPADFSREDYAKGVGAVGHNTIFRFLDDIGFMWSDGSIRSLKATDATGDYTQGALSFDIQTWIRKNVNFTRAKHFWAVNNDEYNHVLFSIAIGGSTNNNYTLMMDYRFQPVRWAMWPAFKSGCLASVIDASDRNRRIVMAGGTDGYVRKYNRETTTIDGLTAIDYKITTPFFNYGSPVKSKTITTASISTIKNDESAVTFGWVRDENPGQTQTITKRGYTTLGSFVLGTDVLASESILDLFTDLTEGGQFRSIQYQITDTALVNFELHGFGAGINMNEGWNTE